MKGFWAWILACIAVGCLLWSLGLQASINPESSFEKHSVAWPEQCSPSGYRELRVLSRTLIRSRADPQEFFFAPDVFLTVEDLSSVGPPWLEYRGPPGRNPETNGWAASRDGRDGGTTQRGKLPFHPEFSARLMAGVKNAGFFNRL
jgi:hypothetical protein